MSFLHPLGLLGLLAIPVLILIYIIKSKYTEQTISSTYLWTLSERFLKRKNPINKLTGIISLILQILAVVFISLALAHPVFVLKGRANDYCFVLDGSGSMNITMGGGTRFDAGKNKISDIISSAADGSTFTLVTTGDTTDVVMREESNKKQALLVLGDVKPSYAEADFTNAVAVVQEFFDVNPSCKYYLVTDKEVENPRNVEVIGVRSEVNNFALDGVDYELGVNGEVTVAGKVISYSGGGTVDIDVFADGGKTAVATARVELAAGEVKDFTAVWENDGETDFASLRAAIRQKDGLALDNDVILYNVRSDASYTTLIVSDTPFFVEAALSSFGNIKREVVKTSEYNDNMRGYGLYVFQNYVPDSMPPDGAVWFLNPSKGIEGAGFSVRGTASFPNAVTLSKNSSTASRVRNLLKGTTDKDFGITGLTRYVKCGPYKNFIELLYCNGDPVVFAGTNDYRNREVVFAFNFLYTSDAALAYNMQVLMHNLLGYTFPALTGESSVYCGQSVEINLPAGNNPNIRVQAPSGKVGYPVASDAYCEYELTEVGEYLITVTVGGNVQTARIYSQLPVAERVVGATEASFVISGEPVDGKRDGKYEDLLYAFIILAVIVVADWLVYCYEQYQLR